MFNEEMRSLLAQVISSWQVLAVTVVLIFYVFLINFVARTHHRSRGISMPRIKRPKASKASAPSDPEAVSDDDELGLDDTAKK